MAIKKNLKLCTWAIPKFDREVKNKFAAHCKIKGMFIRDMLKQILLKETSVRAPNNSTYEGQR